MKSKIKGFEKNDTSFLSEKLVLYFTVALLFLTVTILSVSCKPNADAAGVVSNSKEEAIDSMKVVMEKQNVALAKQKSIDSMQAILNKQQVRSNRQTVVQSAPVAETRKRKGWSGAAKGAVIGAGVGAVSGSVINKKNPTEGAIIGGLAGAGLGAGTGAIIDSEKKKKSE